MRAVSKILEVEKGAFDINLTQSQLTGSGKEASAVSIRDGRRGVANIFKALGRSEPPACAKLIQTDSISFWRKRSAPAGGNTYAADCDF